MVKKVQKSKFTHLERGMGWRLWVAIVIFSIFFTIYSYAIISRLHGVNAKIVVVFYIYVSAIPLFAGVYYLTYRRDQEAFQFAGGTTSSEKRRVLLRLGATQEQGSTLNEALSALKSNAALIYRFYGDGRFSEVNLEEIKKSISFAIFDALVPKLEEIGIKKRVSIVSWGGAGFTCIISCLFPRAGIFSFLYVGRESTVIGEAFRFLDTSPSNIEDEIEYHEEAFRSIQMNIEILCEKAKTIDEDYPDIWNYIDFLYFSTITQTTVGYGDILPNNRTVRMLVYIQILVGYILLAVLLNVVIS